MKSTYKIDGDYQLGRKLSEDSDIVAFVAETDFGKFKIFFFPGKDESFLASFNKTPHAEAEKDELLRVVDFGVSDDGTPFIVLPYQQWSTLRSVISKGPVSINHALQIILALLKQLKKIHSSGFFDFRITPENIFVLKSGELRIFPFNRFNRFDILELISSKKTKTQTFYIAPEQLKNVNADKASGYYALGIIFYELLFGVVPFYDQLNVEVFKQHLDSDPPSPIEFVSGDHRRLFEITKMLLSKDPSIRLDYINQIEAELKNILQKDICIWSEIEDLGYPSLDGESITGEDDLLPLKNQLLQKITSLDLMQGGFCWIYSEPGSSQHEFLLDFILSARDDKPNIISYFPFKKNNLGWQGISEIVTSILGRIKHTEKEKYSSLLNQSVIRMLSEKDYFSTLYSEEYFNDFEIEKQLKIFFKTVSLWSPFILIIQDFHLLDVKSRRLLLALSRLLPGLPIFMICTSTGDYPLPENAEKFLIKGLSRKQILKIIKNAVSVDDKQALLAYNRIIIKSGQQKKDVQFFIHWLKSHPDAQDKIPGSIFDLIKKMILKQNEYHRSLLNEIISWPFPPPLSIFSKDEIDVIKDLERDFLVRLEGNRHIVVNHPLVLTISEAFLPPKKRNERLAQYLSMSLEKKPWFWVEYLHNIETFISSGREIFFRTLKYYYRLNCNTEALFLLDTLINLFPEFSEDRDIDYHYFEIYMHLGSYDAALNHLQKLLADDSLNINLNLHKLSLLFKMDRDSEAESLIRTIEKLPDIGEETEAQLYFFIGSLLARENKNKAALIKLRSAREKYHSLNHRSKMLEVVNAEVSLLRKMGQDDDALKLLEFSKSVSQQFYKPKFMFWSLKQCGDIYLMKENFVKAAEAYQEAYNVPINIDSEDEFADLMFNRGNLQWLIGDNVTALDFFQKAIEKYKRSGLKKELLKALGNQAVIYRETGQPGKALKIEKEVLNTAGEIDEKGLVCVALNNLGQIYTDLNQLPKAKKTFETVIQSMVGLNDLLELFRAYLGLSSVYFKERLFAESAKYIEKAAAINPSETRYFRNDLDYYLGKLSFYNKNYIESEKYALSFLNHTKMSFKYQALGKFLLAENKRASGDTDMAMDYVSEAFNLARIAGLDPVMQKVLWLKAEIHLENNQKIMAQTAIDQSVLLIYKISANLDDEIDRLIYREGLEFASVFKAYKNHFAES